MTEYLVFRLWGPLCSWGEIAVGESRHTADHPSRSALLGLLAASLGIERGEESAHHALSEACRFGLKVLSPGRMLRDYHTVQAPRRSKVRHRTRRSELLTAGVNTLLSTREYRADGVSVVAATLRSGTRWTLHGMQAALQQPCFPLYLGRKSCPPGLPLAPRIVRAETLRAALDAEHLPLATLPWHGPERDSEAAAWPASADRRVFRIDELRYFWDESLKLEDTGPEDQDRNYIEFLRYDEPLSRRRWQFTRRRERGWLTSMPKSEPAKDGAS